MKKSQTQEQEYFDDFKKVLIASFPQDKTGLKNACIYATSELTGFRISTLIDKGVLKLSEYREVSEFMHNAKYKYDRDRIQDIIDQKFLETHGVKRKIQETRHIFSGEMRKDPAEKYL